MLGLGQGSSFSPTGAQVVNPTNSGQINTAYNGTQNSMQQQNALLSALQGQNGLNNQNQVYGQLQGVVNGTGPNPAQAQLAQATGANSANQAALMAGQRGAGSNIGLMARQAAMQGGANQQAAAGQAATLQANQSLNALNQAGSMANTQASNLVGQTNANTQAQQAEQQNLMNAQQATNANNVAMQSNMNNVSGQLANTSAQGQQGLVGGLMNSMGPMLSQAGGAISNGLSGLGGWLSSGATSIAGGVGDAMSSGGAADAAMMMAAQGGEVKKMADGGDPSSSAPFQSNSTFGMQSKFGQFLAGKSNDVQPQANAESSKQTQSGPAALNQGMTNLGKSLLSSSSSAPSTGMAKGGVVKSLVSKGETYLPPSKVDKVVKDGKNPLKEGEKIPGKPQYPGNDYRNDVVPKNLKEGGVVIPNAVMQSADPAHEAYKFVQSVVSKRKVRR